jgi:hypothetical protein
MGRSPKCTCRKLPREQHHFYCPLAPKRCNSPRCLKLARFSAMYQSGETGNFCREHKDYWIEKGLLISITVKALKQNK